MGAAVTIAESVLSDIASLAVPWWGWAALLLMIFWGLLIGAGAYGSTDESDDEAAKLQQLS